jgi:hypothetical protein
MEGLIFCEGPHTYTLDGRPVPGVTSVLKALPNEYGHVAPEVMAAASALGTAVHRVIELDVRRELDEEDLDPVLLPYLGQWREFLATSGFRVLGSELEVASRKYGYAGKLDLVGVLHGRKALVDAKRTAQVPRSAGPQTAGYKLATQECRPDLIGPTEPCDRYALHLTPKNWRLVPFKDPADQRVFLSCLTIHHWSNAA